MWDRRNYMDTDFGLVDDESFEPSDGDSRSDVDTTVPYIMTVLGPIEPDELGVCQHHEHILCDPVSRAQVDEACRLDRIDLASEELESFFTSGGRSMVDASPIDYGRNAEGLRAISQRVPVHIITVTGRHKHHFAGCMPNALDVESLLAEYLGEITDGIGNSGIRPGVIKFGTSLDEITDVERNAGIAAARAAVKTGLPVTTHTESGTMAHEQLDLVESEGLSPTRVILGHLDRKLDVAYLTSLAERGAWISFDQIGKERFGEDGPKAAMIMKLAEAGYADQLLVSQDLARSTDFVAYGGGPGWIHLLERFTLTLMEAGATAQLVRALLVDNPSRALAIHPTST